MMGIELWIVVENNGRKNGSRRYFGGVDMKKEESEQ